MSTEMMMFVWNKWTHSLANQFLIIFVFLNTYPVRCGGWELIEKDDMVAQLAGGRAPPGPGPGVLNLTRVQGPRVFNLTRVQG